MSAREQLTAGVDPGSNSVKVVIAKSRAGAAPEILAQSIQRIRRREVAQVVDAVFDEAEQQAGVKRDDLDYIASTGDGDAVRFHTGHFYSMTTHARGALHLDPDARAVLDLGALHARAIRINEQGRVLNQRMTSQCASGSGQFLENIARYLGVALEDVGQLSCQAHEPEKVSSICAVLAETDVINMVSRGISTADILGGIHLSIAGRLVRLMRSAGAEGTVLLSGGLANDVGLYAAIEKTLGEETSGGRKTTLPRLTLRAHGDSIFTGAIGAALLGAYRYDQLEKSGRLGELVPAA